MNKLMYWLKKISVMKVFHFQAYQMLKDGEYITCKVLQMIIVFFVLLNKFYIIALRHVLWVC